MERFRPNFNTNRFVTRSQIWWSGTEVYSKKMFFGTYVPPVYAVPSGKPHGNPFWYDPPLPKDYWKNNRNQRKFLDWIRAELGYKELGDMVHVKNEDIIKHGADGLLKRHSSLFHCVLSNYPEHQWHPWHFDEIPHVVYADPKSHRRFFDWYMKETSIRTMDDWYNQDAPAVRKAGGGPILAKYNDSLLRALQTSFNDHTWVPWKFKVVPQSVWDDADNEKSFVKFVFEKLNIKNMDNFKLITAKQVSDLGGKGLVDKHGGLSFLEKHIPVEWKEGKI